MVHGICYEYELATGAYTSVCTGESPRTLHPSGDLLVGWIQLSHIRLLNKQDMDELGDV